MPELPPDATHIDSEIVFVLTADEPQFCNKASVCRSQQHRRVGYTYYDRSFAQLLIGAAMQEHGRARPIRTRMLTQFVLRGAPLAALLPRNVRGWLDLLEDVMQAPFVQGAHTSLVQECLRHEELLFVGIDTTLRIMLRIKGQARFDAPKQHRMNQPVADSAALRRVLTVRGRTGAVLAMEPVATESSGDIGKAFLATLDPRALAQILYWESDQPSASLWEELKQVCPNLQCLMLDPVHLVIVYNNAFCKKKHESESLLRIIMANFNAIDFVIGEGHWGPMHCGNVTSTAGRPEARGVHACMRARLHRSQPTFTPASAVLRAHTCVYKRAFAHGIDAQLAV